MGSVASSATDLDPTIVSPESSTSRLIRCCGAGKKSQLSVGFVCQAWPPGDLANGIVSYYSALVPAIEAQGCQVTILAYQVRDRRFHPQVLDIHESLRQRGLMRRLGDAVAFRLFPRSAFDRQSIRHLREAFLRARDQRGVQVIQIEESFGWARLAARSIGLPICLRLHGPWCLVGPALGVPRDAEFQARVAAEGEAIRQAEFLSAPSLDVIDRVRTYYDLPLEHAQVIPSTVTPPPQKNAWRLDACDPNLILFVGRFDRLKGGDLLFRAFREVLQTHPRTRLVFVGPDRGCILDDGQAISLPDFVESLLPGALASGQITWLGKRSLNQIRQMRQQALVTVVCSRYETFSNTTAEAAAAGCPIVAAHVGGIPSILEHERSGLLHIVGDHESLAHNILRLLEDPLLAERLGRHARADFKARLRPEVIATRTSWFLRNAVRQYHRRTHA